MKNLCFTIALTIGFLSLSALARTQNKIETHYRIFGKGEPILIINGGPGMNSEGFAYIAEEISKLNYQTIIYDQRGTGQSKLDSLTENTITMDLMVEDLENLRKKLRIKKWVVMGQSFGGILATHYVAKYPKSIKKIIFSCSGGVNLKFLEYVNNRVEANLSQMELDSMGYYDQKIEAGDTTRATALNRARCLASAYIVNKSYRETIAQRLIQVNRRVNALVYIDLNKIKFDYTNQFKKMKTPVLVLQGKNDIISTETAEEIKNSFGNAQLVLFDNCGHYGWLDSKEKYLGAIAAFLKS